jgi:hypothetical protein
MATCALLRTDALQLTSREHRTDFGMAQLFHPSINTISRVSIFGAVIAAIALWWLLAEINHSSYVTQQGVARTQDIPFSHKHHVSGLGLDCRYCHTSVETSAFAGIPATKICMTCHSQVWSDSAMLEPVRASYRSGEALVWRRVYDLPDYVYFNHSIHVKKGIGCVSCHGEVGQMPLVWQAVTLQMDWCLDCHRAPQKYVRPRSAVFKMDWTPPTYHVALGEQLVREYHIESLISCSVCHR